MFIGGRMKKVDLMIFDFDGTLIRSGDDLVSSVNHTLKTLGIPLLEKEKIIGFIGDGVRKLIERSLGDKYSDQFEDALDVFREYYSEHLLDKTDLYPGVCEVLEFFNEKKKVIITNKLYGFTIRIADELGITEYFDAIIGVDSSPYKKPDARLVQKLLNKFTIQANHTVVIGDGINDIMLAKNAGISGCAFMNGLSSRNKLLKLDPEYFYEDVIDLKKMFC